MITLNEQSYDFANLLRSLNTETEFFKISYEYLELPINPQIEIQSTSSFLCRCLLKIENKITKETISTVVNLTHVPVETSMGICINSTYYSICPINLRAGGWYHQIKNRDGKDKITLELVPESGRKIVFKEKNGFVDVNLGSKVKDIPLGIYLKAISGLSYRDIIRKIGYRNPIIFKSFENEKPYKECVDFLLGALIGKHNALKLESIPDQIRATELKRLLGSRYIRLPNSARSRYERTTSFVSRALGLELVNPVLDIPQGKKLTVSDLEKLDANVESILVLKEGKPYELRKLPMGENFLEIDELCTELNIFFNNLDGFGYYDNMFDDLNREVVSVEELARRFVTDKILEIDSGITSNLISPDISLKSLSFGGIDNKLNAFIDKCKTEFDNSQSAETTNGISYLGKRSKVVTSYKGNTSTEIISIKPSQLSSYDLYHIPESKKVGLVWNMTLNSSRNADGEIETSFFKVNKGVVDSSKVIKLTPKDRINKIIAPWDCDFSQQIVKAYEDGRVISVDRSLVDYVEFSVFNSVSLASALIPFAQFSAGKRIVMGCSQNKQAVPCLNSEAPLVSTGALNMTNYGSELVYRAVNLLDELYTREFSGKFHDQEAYEEFLKLPIKLIGLNDSKSDYMEYNFEVHFRGKRYTLPFFLPFVKRGSEDVMYHYFLKHSSNGVYQGNEIVFYNNSIDVKKYDLVKHINMGNGNHADDAMFDFDTALGVNIFTAFKSSGVPNMDDGICISDELLGTYKLAHVKIVEIREEIKRYKKFYYNEFKNGDNLEDHDSNGLPKVGRIFLPKSKFIGQTIVKEKGGQPYTVYSRLPLDKEGQVAYAHIDGDTAIVGLVTIADVEVGDKLAGDHGNKGVVGRIIPKKDMPYTADGKSLQATLNPLGVPSRMNLSQLFVCLIGYAMRLQGKRMILSSQNPDSYEIAMKYLEDPRIKQQQLYDGRTGLPFDRKTTIGYMYLKKQTHTVMSKLNSCAEPESFNVITNQPNKGKARGGGQTIGEYETWNLESLELPHAMQELFTIKSDDIKGRKALKECLTEDRLYSGPMNSTNIHSKQVQLRMFGCDVQTIDGKQVITIMTNNDIRGLSPSPCKNTIESLQDDQVFGRTEKPSEIDSAKSRWSYLDLGKEIINPAFIYKGSVPKLVLVVKVSRDKNDDETVVESRSALSKDRIVDIIRGDAFLSFEHGIIKYSEDASLLSAPEIGIDPVVKAFKMTKLESVRTYYRKAINKLRDKVDAKDREKKIYNLQVLMNTIDSLDEVSKDGTLSCLVIDSFPVLPKNFRFKMDNNPANLDLFYSRIISAIKTGSSTEIYRAVLTLLGLDNKEKLSEDTRAKNFSEFYMGKNSQDKHGFVRENMLSHKVSYSFRSVIAPGKVPLGKLGLPRQICYNLKKLELTHRLKAKFEIFEEVPGLVDEFVIAMQLGSASGVSTTFKTIVGSEYDSKKINHYMEECDKIMRELLSETVVLFGRQPTLKELSIRGLEPVMVEGHAILVNVLLCAGYNADFDGDQMWGAMLHTEESIKEVRENASPVKYMLESKDGSVALSPTQDILLGLYLATMLHGNVLDGSTRDEYKMENVQYFNSINEIKRLVSFGQLNRKDLVCYSHKNGNKYLSTAGRILFNSLLKNGFTDNDYSNSLNLDYINPENYRELKYDGLIKKSDGAIAYKTLVDGKEVVRKYKTIDIDTVLRDEFLTVQPDELNSLLDNMLDFGEESCIVSGIALHLDSFKENHKAEELSAKYEKLCREWQELYELGLMTESEKSSLFIKASNYISSKVKKSILDDYDRNDDLFIIMDSGARGNAGQLMASTGLIGVVSKSATEQIDTPVLKSYKKGLSASDYYVMAHGTLYGVSAVQKDTGKSGEMTREFVYMGSGIKVTESDCGSGFVDIDVIYDGPMNSNVETELLNKRLLKDSKIYKDTIGITKDGLINRDVINYIFKHNITEVDLDDETQIKVKYKVSDLFKNMFMNKLGQDLPHLSRGSIITAETLKYVEENQIKTIKSRTVITCKTKGGICSRCYGILHNTDKLPNIGYPAGVKAGQSIGEPSTQLVLDTINKNGSSDGTVSAIDICKSVIAGSVTDRFKYAILSPTDCGVSVQDTSKFAILNIEGERYQLAKSDLKVVDGEQVKAGQVLSEGLVNVRSIPAYLPNFLYLRKLQQVKSLFYLFFDSNITVDARHFEVLIKAQLDYVKVYSSDCEEIKEGKIYDYSAVESMIAKGHHIEYINEPLNKADRILNVSGNDTVLCHHDPVSVMIRMATNKSIQNDKMSFIGALYSGSDVVSGKLSVPSRPLNVEYVVDNRNREEVTEVNVGSIESFKSQDSQQSAKNSLLSALDLSSIINNNKSKVETSDIKSSNVFGSSDDGEVAIDSVEEIDFIGGFDFISDFDEEEPIEDSFDYEEPKQDLVSNDVSTNEIKDSSIFGSAVTEIEIKDEELEDFELDIEESYDFEDSETDDSVGNSNDYDDLDELEDLEIDSE